MNRFWVPVALIILTISTVGSCNSVDAARRMLDEHRRLWQEQNAANYTFTLRVICFCPVDATTPVNIVVSNCDASEITYVGTTTIVEERYFEDYDTVEKLFAVIEDALKQDVHSLQVEYDRIYGYPVRIDIDYIETAVDEEISFSVSNLHIFGCKPLFTARTSLPGSLSVFPHHFPGRLVPSESQKTRVAQFSIFRPFGKTYLCDQFRS